MSVRATDDADDDPIYWVKLRRDLGDLIDVYRLKASEIGAFAYLCAECGTRGYAYTSGKALAQRFPNDFATERRGKRCLQRLKKAKLIESRQHLGERGKYRVVIGSAGRFASKAVEGPSQRSAPGFRSGPQSGPRREPRSPGRDSTSGNVDSETGPDSGPDTERRRGSDVEPLEGRQADPEPGPEGGPPLREEKEKRSDTRTGDVARHPEASAKPESAAGACESDSFLGELLREWNEAGNRRRLPPLARLPAGLAADLTALFDDCDGDEHSFRDGLRWFFDSEDGFVENRGWDEKAFRARLSGAVAAGRKPARRPNLSAPVAPEPSPPRTAEDREASRRAGEKARGHVARLATGMSVDQGGAS